MPPIKSLALAALCTALSGPAFADAAMQDAKANLYDADYEVQLADHGYAVGVLAYGTNDADYDVFLSDAALFQPVLGQYDADYEIKLNRAAFSELEVAAR